jgi:RNA polymerase sigma-70 factor (ECF subfamily)
MADFTSRLEAEIPALRRYARAILRDPDRADDLVQDCLERAIAKRSYWRRPGNLRAWLFTIMHNLHANQARSLARRPVSLPLDQVAEQGSSANQIESVAVSEVLTALEQLDENQREVLVLVAVEQLRYREVAEVLGLPLGTVMSRLGRARERLRQAMNGDAPEPKASLRRVK